MIDYNFGSLVIFCSCFLIITQSVKTDPINTCTNEQIGATYLRKYGYLTNTKSSGGKKIRHSSE